MTVSYSEPQRTAVKKLAPPSELEQTLAFEAEFGVPAEAIREDFIEKLRSWHDKALRGLFESTAPYRLVMRDAGVSVREGAPKVIFTRASSVLRAASTGQLAIYERWRRAKESP